MAPWPETEYTMVSVYRQQCCIVCGKFTAHLLHHDGAPQNSCAALRPSLLACEQAILII